MQQLCADARAPPQPVPGIRTARVLPAGPEGSPEHAGGVAHGAVGGCLAAARKGTLSKLRDRCTSSQPHRSPANVPRARVGVWARHRLRPRWRLRRRRRRSAGQPQRSLQRSTPLAKAASINLIAAFHQPSAATSAASGRLRPRPPRPSACVRSEALRSGRRAHFPHGCSPRLTFHSSPSGAPSTASSP